MRGSPHPAPSVLLHVLDWPLCCALGRLGLIPVSPAPNQGPGTEREPGKDLLKREGVERSLGYQSVLSG